MLLIISRGSTPSNDVFIEIGSSLLRTRRFMSSAYTSDLLNSWSLFISVMIAGCVCSMNSETTFWIFIMTSRSSNWTDHHQLIIIIIIIMLYNHKIKRNLLFIFFWIVIQIFFFWCNCIIIIWRWRSITIRINYYI